MDSLRGLHDEIDGRAGVVAKVHAERLLCRRGCSSCCLDGLTVRRIEAERIRRAHPDLLERGEPHPSGGCAFLDSEGACRIYDDRPSVCRSQGLPLRVLFENDEGDIEERRDICPLNLVGGPPLEDLDEESFWLIGPFELRLGRLDEAFTSGADRRVLDESERSDDADDRIALRDLFHSG